MNLPPAGGLDAARVARAETPSTKIVMMIASRAAPRLEHDVARAGAHALVLRSDTEDALIDAIERVHQLSSGEPPSIDAPSLDGTGESLSPRELEGATLIASGRSTKKISAVLGATSKTADTYRKRLMQEPGAHSVVDVMRFAILRHGLVDIE